MNSLKLIFISLLNIAFLNSARADLTSSFVNGLFNSKKAPVVQCPGACKIALFNASTLHSQNDLDQRFLPHIATILRASCNDINLDDCGDEIACLIINVNKVCRDEYLNSEDIRALLNQNP